MPDISMCPEYNCPKRDKCYRYKAIPSGAYQSYMVGRGFTGDDCSKYIELNDSFNIVPEELVDIDIRNKNLLSKWMGVEYD
jgi:hypothetical protein